MLPDFGLAEQVVDNPRFYCDDILKGEKGFFGLEDCSLFRKKINSFLSETLFLLNILRLEV